MSDEDDHDLLRAWRAEAHDAPGEMLDRRILKAAQAQRARRAVLPLAAAMAACLVLAFYAVRPQPVPVMPASPAIVFQSPDTSSILADPDAMRQLTIRNQPGGSAGQDTAS